MAIRKMYQTFAKSNPLPIDRGLADYGIEDLDSLNQMNQ